MGEIATSVAHIGRMTSESPMGTRHSLSAHQGRLVRCSQISLRRMNQGVNGGL